MEKGKVSIRRNKSFEKMQLQELVNNVRKIDAPVQIKELIEKSLTQNFQMQIPIITYKEGDWFISSTPFVDVMAQGKTEDESTDNLQEMIDDVLSDPDIPKPRFENISHVEVTFKQIDIPNPILQGGSYNRRQDKAIET